MTKDTLKQIVENQINELLAFKTEKSSQLSTDEYLTLHLRLEMLVRCYENLFLKDCDVFH